MNQDTMNGGGAVEDTLSLLASCLQEAKKRICGLFTQNRIAQSAGQFLDVLLGDEPRKTGWARGEAAGDSGPWRQQALLGRGSWDADRLRDIVRDYVIEQLSDDNAVLVIDETGFLKQGKSSCGVSRQYTGSAGKITNCQIGVFATYVSEKGHAFIDRALYLPKSWTDDPPRMKAAHVPESTKFATKPTLAVEMVKRAVAADIPFSWVVADSVYGVAEVEAALRCAGKGYVLGVASTHWFGSWGHDDHVSGRAKEIAASLAPESWKRLSAGSGTKGERLYDWAYCPLAHLDTAQTGPSPTPIWTKGLLIRRSLSDNECAYFSTWSPKGTLIETLVRVEGNRWRVEECFETGKNEFGLDHNETRSWHGWSRHVSMVMLAFAVMAIVRYQANQIPLKKTLMVNREN
jgi:SRSO17 transposase